VPLKKPVFATVVCAANLGKLYTISQQIFEGFDSFIRERADQAPVI
jgi:hypothetical protein